MFFLIKIIIFLSWFLDNLLFNINKKVKNSIIIESSILYKENLKSLIHDEEFKHICNFLRNIIIEDLDLNSNNNDLVFIEGNNNSQIEVYIKEIEELLLQIYGLFIFCNLNNFKGFDTFSNWFNQLEFITFLKKEKYEFYKIKKGEIRKKKWRAGLIIQGYKHILFEMKDKLNSIIIQFIILYL